MLKTGQHHVLWCMCSLLFLPLCATAAFAGTLIKGDIVKLSWGNGTVGHAQGGGEFALFKLTGVDAQQQDVWQRLSVPLFCVEYDEHVWLDTKMVVGSLSDRAVFGGQSGQVFNSSGQSLGDPIDVRTQFLYDSYATHALSAQGYVYGNNAWADSLQEAIWKIEGEKLKSNGTFAGFSTSQGKNLYDYANTYNGPALNTVFVLNLFALNTPAQALKLFDPLDISTWSAVAGYRRQDQLFYNPEFRRSTLTVPEPFSLHIWLTTVVAFMASTRLRHLIPRRLLPVTLFHQTPRI